MSKLGLQILSVFLKSPDDISHFTVRDDSLLTLRIYPRQAPNRMLGAHCDANELTILWATLPGLQVPDDDDKLVPEDIKDIGIPTLTGPMKFCEQWCDVETSEHVFIVSIGTGFFNSKLWQRGDGKGDDNGGPRDTERADAGSPDNDCGTGAGDDVGPSLSLLLDPQSFSKCALLHRVHIKTHDTDRYSVPYLLRLQRTDDDQA
jgi:hypothetical protein